MNELIPVPIVCILLGCKTNNAFFEQVDFEGVRAGYEDIETDIIFKIVD